MDDTNPAAEKIEYIESIVRDVKWLGGDFGKNFFHASDHFEQLYDMAIILIKKGLAYIDDQTKEQMLKTRGSIMEKGTNSPFRNRTVDENLALFAKMKAGTFVDGACTLRAKIDMEHPQPCMRDPPMYRIIRDTPHPHTGTKWKIYPMYDFAHGLSDALEGISHSVCTLEFVPRRELYNWFVDNVGDAACLPKGIPRPKQYEMSRLNLETVSLSKRRLIKLVDGNYVKGWDDPRMPTISAFRRAGIPASAIQDFCKRVGVTKKANVIELGLWNACIRDALNPTSPRVMAVIDPLKVVITNIAEGVSESFDAPYMPASNSTAEADSAAKMSRRVTLGRNLYIEKSDFMEVPEKGWRRLFVGGEVRLRYACFLKCVSCIKNAAGEVVELQCTWDPATKGGKAPDGRKPKGTLHWVNCKQAVPAEMRLYSPLFKVKEPAKLKEEEFVPAINVDSLIIKSGFIESADALNKFPSGKSFQFERMGYFCQDIVDSKAPKYVFNRICLLRDETTTKMKIRDHKRDASAAAPKSLTWQNYRDMSEEERSALSKGERKKLEKKMKKGMKKAGIAVPAQGGGKAAAHQGKSKKKKPTKQKKQQPVAAAVDFSRFDIRVGLVTKAWKLEGYDKMYGEMIDLGEEEPRTIASGLWGKVPQSEFQGSRVLVMCNLPPKPLKDGFKSNGMVLAAEVGDVVELIRPPAGAALGSRVMVAGCNGEPASTSWMKKKKKKWSPMFQDMKTNSTCEACYKGTPWMVGGAACTVASVTDALIH